MNTSSAPGYDPSRDRPDGLITACHTEASAPLERQHFHGSPEFLYVHTGCILARMGEREILVPPGHLLALSSFLPHDCPRSEGEIYQLILPRSGMSGLDGLMEGKTFDKAVLADPDGQLYAQMRLIHEMNARIGLFAALDGDEARRAAASAAMALVRVLIPLLGLRAEPGSTQPVLQAIRYLSEHFREEIRIGELARRFFCHRSLLSAGFLSVFGMTMNEYVNRLRAAEVRRLLAENPALTLSEAAAMAGFGSLRSLHRAYREVYGRTPRHSG